MKRISNSDLLVGLEYPNQEVQKAYLTFALKKWLTSKSYGPQCFDEVMELKELCPPQVYKLFSENTVELLPNLIAEMKRIDFAKIDLLMQNDWKLGKIFSFKIAYAALINLDAYPNAGFNRLSKKTMVEKWQKELMKIEDMEVWECLLSLGELSHSGLKIFSSWLQKQEKESHVDFSVVRILCDKAKIQACFAQRVFNLSLYLIGNFRGFMNEAVKILDDFCSCYPMFRKSLEKFLLKNYNRYFWKLEPYPHRNPLQYYKEMMEHLTSECLHFSISWKMKIVQKMLNQAENRAIVLLLLDNLKLIYDFQVNRADEAYFEAIKTGLKKKKDCDDEVLSIVISFAKGTIFNTSGLWWKEFAKYPMAFQKTMALVYSSNKLSECGLAQAYFALVFMHQKNPNLFDDFEKLAVSILAKNWDVSNQDLISFFYPFQWCPYDEATSHYLLLGCKKLLQIAQNQQAFNLWRLKFLIPLYAKILENEDLKSLFDEIEKRQLLQQKEEEEKQKEIALLLAKLQ